ncbi:unnamed protein product [Mucor hiemalis]
MIFFFSLSPNIIFVITDVRSLSQIGIVTTDLKAELDRGIMQYNSSKLTKTLKNEGSLAIKLQSIEKIDPVSKIQRAQQKVSRYMQLFD